jgi:hypothetical protein
MKHDKMLVQIDDKTRKAILADGLVSNHFRRWDDIDFIGISVAHVCARLGLLPADFDLWWIADEQGGDTVALEPTGP